MKATLNCGGDTDTVGAIVGALMGAVVGPEGIPRRWQTGIAEWPRSRAVLEITADRLAEQKEDGRSQGEVRYFWPGVIIRNLAFTTLILFHGLQRLIPQAKKEPIMLAIKFIKVPPTSYLIQYKKGQIVMEGLGSPVFILRRPPRWWWCQWPVVEAPFIFNEVTADFQAVTIQGRVTYRVDDPKKLAQLMDFTLDSTGAQYVSEDNQKLPQRVVQSYSSIDAG